MYLNLVFNNFIWTYKYCTYFLQIRSNLLHENPHRSFRDGGSSPLSARRTRRWPYGARSRRRHMFFFENVRHMLVARGGVFLEILAGDCM
jgi:hypothetical protein